MAKSRVEAMLHDDLISKMDVAREELSLSRTGFIAVALAAYLRRWKSPLTGNAPAATWPSGWPKNAKCPRCKKLGHDPDSHGFGISSYDWEDVAKLTVANA